MMMISRSNKSLGDEYEREVVDLLFKQGYWVHFVERNKAGAQPFDIIAVKNERAYAIDCKTLDDKEKYFRLSRLEDNQITSFQRWLQCGNNMPLVFVKHDGTTHVVRFEELIKNGKVNIDEISSWEGHTDL